MNRTPALFSASLLAILTFQTAGPAQASDESLWLRDRKYREGAGFRVGDFELHPGVGAEFGYDSNYFRRASDEDPIGSLQLRISPSFSVATLGPQRRGEGPPPSVDFRADIRATYHEFFPVSGSDAGQERLQEQRNVSGEVNLALDILPQRTWSGHIGGGLGRTVRATDEGDLTDSFNRLLPYAKAELVWTPNSGLLDWRLGYNFEGTFFESGSFSDLNHFENAIITRGRWRFLPRTALLYDLSLGFITYPSDMFKTSSHPLRARLGVNGLITSSFALLAMVGWGASFYTGDSAVVQDFDSVIGQLELKWYLTAQPATDPTKVSGAQSSISVGFVREFQDSYLGTYLERDRGYAKFNYLIGGVFLIAVQGGAGAVLFPNIHQPAQANAWTDARADAELLAEYRIKDWLGVNADVAWTGYFSGTRLALPKYPGYLDNLAFQNVRAFLGVRWFM